MKAKLEELVTEMVDRGIPFQEAVAEFEKHFIFLVIKRRDGNLSKAAEELGIHRNTLSKRVAKFGGPKYYQNGHMMGARHRRLRAQTALKAAAAKSRG